MVSRRRPKPKPESESPDKALYPAVARLPQKLRGRPKSFWNKYIGKPFEARIAHRGSKTNTARDWTRQTFTGEFCNEFNSDLNEEERAHYETILGEPVYSYLSNHTARGTPGVQPKATRIKARKYGQDVWARDLKHVFQPKFNAYMEAHPDLDKSIGTRRRVVGLLFKELPKDEQEMWRQKAKDKLTTAKAIHRLTEEARALYIRDFPKKMMEIIREAEVCAGIQLNIQVLTEEFDSKFTITTLMSEGIKDFRKSAAMPQMLHSLKKWVESTGTREVKEGAPTVTAYPDDENEGHPLIPDFVGMHLPELQKLLRLVINLKYIFGGGAGKSCPWEEIGRNPEKWIDPERMPEGAVWKDPSAMNMSQVLLWLCFLRDCQDGLVPDEKKFQFRRVYADLSPIDISKSQETSRKLVTRGDKQTYILEFDTYITRCHAPGGMRYPKASIEYGRFLAEQESAAEQAPPDKPEWQGLPTGNRRTLAQVLGEEELKTIRELIGQFHDEEDKGLATSLLDTLVEFSSHIPALTQDGLWSSKSPLPTIFPSTKPDSLHANDFFADFWAPVTYFLGPRKVPREEDRFSFFDSWIEESLEGDLLRHLESGSLLGGLSAPWVARALLKFLFNFKAITNSLDPRPSCPMNMTLPDSPSTTSRAYTSDDRRACRVTHAADDVEAAAVPAHADSSSKKRKRGRKIKKNAKGKSVATEDRKRGGKRQKLGDLWSDSEDSAVPSGSGTDPESEEDFDARDGGSDDDLDEEPEWSFSSRAPAFDRGDSPGIADIPLPVRKGRPRGKDVASKGPEPSSKIPPYPSLSDLEAIDKCDIVFGGFPNSPAPPMPRAKESFPSLWTAVQSAIQQSRSLLDEWYALTAPSEFDRAQDILSLIHDEPNMFEVWLIVALVLHWDDAREMAPEVVELAQRMYAHGHHCTALHLACRELALAMKRGPKVGNHDLEGLHRLDHDMCVTTAELIWNYDELVSLARHATFWSEAVQMPTGYLRLVNDWVNDPWRHHKLCPPAPANLHPSLVRWCKSTIKLREELLLKRRETWAALGRPFDPRHDKSGMGFLFGNINNEHCPRNLNSKFIYYF
ncbi:hypothetical protein FRC08_010994 [Ceratobasidium sp. 394]|nr:hypothetical protein FRC08_010994 [Ceratobasidium sp. 394]